MRRFIMMLQMDLLPYLGGICMSLLSTVMFNLAPVLQKTALSAMPEIKANNPGITIMYDGFFAGQLVLSSSIGGSVISPGEGTFPTVFGDSFTLEVEADPGFVFVGWSGSYSTTQNPLPLTIDQDYTLRANFVSILHTIHVDDDASVDPGPCNPPSVIRRRTGPLRIHSTASGRGSRSRPRGRQSSYMQGHTARSSISSASRSN